MRRGLQKAPRSTHSEHQPFIEEGAWLISSLRRRHEVVLAPWTAPENLILPDSREAAVKRRNPLEIAHRYQALLDSGVVKSRAQLARFLGVSRARVTQVLSRLDGTSGMNGVQR